MHRFNGAIAVFLCAWTGAAARADLAVNFAANPLTDPNVLVQGPGAAGAASRFTWTAGALTAHYDTTQPTIKLVFPLGRHFTQATSFSTGTTFKVLSAGFDSPPDFGAQALSFGLVNSITTGSNRASTGYYDSSFNFIEATPGNSYDLLSMDYFPTQDKTFGGSSVDLTAIHTAQAGVDFNSSFSFGYTSASLPMDQSITATLAYSAATHLATLDWGAGLVTADLTGAAFDVDSFAITLWQDPNLAPAAPATASGSPVAADVVFSSLSVVPEPGSVTLLAFGMALVAGRRARRAARASHRA